LLELLKPSRRRMSRFARARVLAPLVAAVVLVVGAAQPLPRYRDATLPVEARVADLVGRMTLEEKVAQLEGIWRRAELQDAADLFDPVKAKPLLGFGIGEIARPSEITGTPTGPRLRTAKAQAEFVNAVQRWVLENTRLG